MKIPHPVRRRRARLRRAPRRRAARGALGHPVKHTSLKACNKQADAKKLSRRARAPVRQGLPRQAKSRLSAAPPPARSLRPAARPRPSVPARCPRVRAARGAGARSPRPDSNPVRCHRCALSGPKRTNGCTGARPILGLQCPGRRRSTTQAHRPAQAPHAHLDAAARAARTSSPFSIRFVSSCASSWRLPCTSARGSASQTSPRPWAARDRLEQLGQLRGQLRQVHRRGRGERRAGLRQRDLQQRRERALQVVDLAQRRRRSTRAPPARAAENAAAARPCGCAAGAAAHAGRARRCRRSRAACRACSSRRSSTRLTETASESNSSRAPATGSRRPSIPGHDALAGAAYLHRRAARRR